MEQTAWLVHGSVFYSSGSFCCVKCNYRYPVFCNRDPVLSIRWQFVNLFQQIWNANPECLCSGIFQLHEHNWNNFMKRSPKLVTFWCVYALNGASWVSLSAAEKRSTHGNDLVCCCDCAKEGVNVYCYWYPVCQLSLNTLSNWCMGAKILVFFLQIGLCCVRLWLESHYVSWLQWCTFFITKNIE